MSEFELMERLRKSEDRLRDIKADLSDWLDECWDQSVPSNVILRIYEEHFGPWAPMP
jgi:hypothetical protein